MNLRTIATAALLFAGASSVAGAQQANPIQIEAPWARASIGRSTMSAAYMTLVNTAKEPDRLIAAASPAAGKVELHTNVREGEVVKMREVPAVELKSGERVEFAPGGLHMMLIDLKEPLESGQTVPLTLEFEKAGTLRIEIPVRQRADAGHGGHGSGHGAHKPGH